MCNHSMINRLKISFLFLIVCLLQACAATTPPSVSPYLNRTYYLSDPMYFTTVRDLTGSQYHSLVHPGRHVRIGYVAPSFSEYRRNPASRQNSLLGTHSSIDGIVPAGTPFVLSEYSHTPIEGYLTVKILLKGGQFAGKLTNIGDEDTLLKSMHLKKIKKDVTYWQEGKTYHREVLLSPFSSNLN